MAKGGFDMAIRTRTILAAAAVAGGALLAGCADVPYNGYYGNNGYYDNGYAYDYGPGPAYYDSPAYYGAPSVGFGIGFSSWDDGHRHDWHGDRDRHEWHGGDRGGGHDWRNDHGQNSGG
jgi:hypothetical protein